MSAIRQCLLDAVKNNPRDLVAHKVLADWLDEFGDDADHDLAEIHRNWTLEKQDSLEWLKSFDDRLRAECRKWNDEDDKSGPSQESLSRESQGDDGWGFIGSLRNYLDHNDYEVLSVTTPDMVYEEMNELWSHFEIVTGVTPFDPHSHKYPPRTPFSCSC